MQFTLELGPQQKVMASCLTEIKKWRCLRRPPRMYLFSTFQQTSTLPKMWVILQPVIFLTGICSQTQPTEHDATAAKESYTRSLPHSTSGVLPAQGSTTFISNPAPLHAASSISSPGIPFSYDTPSANFNVKGHVNPPVPRSCKSMMGR